MDNFDLKKFLIENKITRNSRLLNENVDFDKWAHNDTHGVEVVWKPFPANPDEMLTQHDDEYLDPDNPESENFTKASFWDTDISKMNKIEQGYHEPGDVIYASKLPNGTWLITWDSGEISGFNEGEDFEFIPEDEL